MFKKTKSRNKSPVPTFSAETLDCFPGPDCQDHGTHNILHSPAGDTCPSRSLSPGRGTSIEVFRNNTTAVEVMVKELHPKSNKHSKLHVENESHKIHKLQKEIEDLKIDLNIANNKLVVSRKGFSKLVTALYKQLDTVSRREMEQQSQNVLLQLENEKIKTLSEAKDSLLNKLKKEVAAIKRLLKFLVKSMKNVPMMSSSHACAPDHVYDEYEMSLKDLSNTYEDFFGTTFNSSTSKHTPKK